MTDAIPTIWSRLYNSRFRDVLRGRLDSSLDWRQTIASASLPAELADAVGQLVGNTRLWRREKVDVAAELAGHFQDGLDAGHSPAELLQSFGDTKAAAQLIRRAKKRGRSFSWHAWHYCWIGAVALVFVYIAAGIWMSTDRPTVNVDYLALLTKPVRAVPENDRAWPTYRDALLAMGANLIDGHSSFLDIAANESNPGDEYWKDTEKYLAEHAASIAKLREAASRPNLGFVPATSQVDFSEKDRQLFGFHPTTEAIEAAKHETWQDRFLISAFVPHLQLLRSSALLLASDARRAAAAGDGQTALDDVIAILGISRHCEEIPFMISLVLASSVQSKAEAAIQDVLVEHPALWTDSQLRDLAHKFAASRIDWRRGFEGERSSFYDCMQRIYTDNGRGDGRLALHVSKDTNLFQLLDAVGGNNEAAVFGKEGVAILSIPAANMVVASRGVMTDLYEKVTNQAISRLGMPYWQWAGEPTLDDTVQSLRNEWLGHFRYLFVLLLTPSHDVYLNRVVTTDGNRDGVLIGLALEMYHRENAKWPKSLDELSPRWLPAVPLDPITGKPLHYKVVNDRPMVYSVGIDGDDDGGRWAKADNGETHADLASPNHFEGEHESVRYAHRDGDWVIWSTMLDK